MQKFFLTIALLALTAVAHAADSPKDVQALVARGDYAGAEAALRQAVSEHPQSAKAHYVLAEVLAHEGNIGEAKAEATKAATLDPSTKFTDPAKFQQFQQKLNQALAPESRTRSAASTSALSSASSGIVPATAEPEKRGGISLMTLLVIGVIVVAIIAFVVRRRRQADFDNANYRSPVGGMPPSSGYPPAGPYGQGYNGQGYNGPGYPPAAPRSGAGAAVAAGLGGLAAGALLDEAFRSHGEGAETVRDVNGSAPVAPPADPSGQAYDDLRDEPVDFGNNDSSWDDSSSGDIGGSDDDQW